MTPQVHDTAAVGTSDSARAQSAAHGGRGQAAARGRGPAALLPRAALRGVVGALVFFAAAEAFTRLEIVDPRYLPYASTVVERMVELVGDGAFLREVWATLYGWMLALGAAIAIAVPLGILLGSSDMTYRATSAVIEVMRPIPAVALIPLAILVWGSGTITKVILVTYATVWPILYNTIYGVHDVDAVAVESARAFGLPRSAIVRRVVLPSAAPFVLTGVRISASIGLIVIVGTELVAGTATGIGAYILAVGAAGEDVDVVLAGAAIAGLLGVVINMAFGALDRRAFAWAHRGGAA
jgi:NitT/TauT family transport system permease protein